MSEQSTGQTLEQGVREGQWRIMLRTWSLCLSVMGAVGKLEQRPTWSDWSALVVPGCRCWWRVDEHGFEPKQVHSQAGAGELVQPERLRDVITGSTGASSSCCLVNRGLSGLLGTPLQTHTAGLRLDAPCCLHVKPQDRHLLLEAPLCGNAGHQTHPGGRSPHPFLCPVPTMQWCPRKAPSPTTGLSSHLYNPGRLPKLLQP